MGVAVAELVGEVCCELKRVYCVGDAVNCCTGIAKSVAISFVGFWVYSSLSSNVEEVGRRVC